MKRQAEATKVKEVVTAILVDRMEGLEGFEVEVIGSKIYLFDKEADFHVEVTAVVKDPEKFDIDEVREEHEQKQKEKAEKKEAAEKKKAEKLAKKSKSVSDEE